MTLLENIDYIKLLLRRVDKTNKYHYNEIKFALSKAFNQMLYDSFRKDPDSLDFYAREYTSQTVTLNATTLRYYTNLPAPIVQLPGMDLDEGVRDVNTNAGVDINFYPTSQEDHQLNYNQDSYLVDDTVPYMVRADKIIYLDDPPAAVISTGVRLSLVIPISEYADTDEIPVPAGRDTDMIMNVFQFLGQVPPVDLRNNNSD